MQTYSETPSAQKTADLPQGGSMSSAGCPCADKLFITRKILNIRNCLKHCFDLIYVNLFLEKKKMHITLMYGKCLMQKIFSAVIGGRTVVDRPFSSNYTLHTMSYCYHSSSGIASCKCTISIKNVQNTNRKHVIVDVL